MASLQTDWWEMLRQTWRGGIDVSPCGRVREWGVCHFQPLHVIPVLLYRLWASPTILLGIVVLTVMSGLIPLYRLGCRRLGMHWPKPPHAQQLRDAARILAVGLDHHG